MDTSNKQKAIALVEMIASDNTDALAYIDPAVFVQHDPSMADGLEGYRELSAQRSPDAKIEVVRVFEERDHVITHSLYDLGQPKAAIDIYRFEDGKAVEHWNNFQDFAAPNPSGRTLLDGATEVTDFDSTEQNKEIVRDFLVTHLVNGSDDIARFFDGDTYIQHNSSIGDGVSGLLAAGEAFRKAGVVAEFTDIHQVLGQGNFVLGVSEGHTGSTPVSFFDLYRLENGKIIEHWDVLETIMPEDTRRNSNGKF